MHELARQHYLDAMGIHTYMPRLVLPVAPIPVQCDLSGLVSDAPAEIPAPPAEQSLAQTRPQGVQGEPTAATEPGAKSADEILASMGALSAPTTKTSSKPAPKLKAARAEAAAHFAVSLWQFAGLIVMADRHAEQALPVNLLLKNILVALGRTRDKTDAPEVLKWPIEGLPIAQAGPALTYFGSIISARRLPEQATTLLCFGETIAKQLLPDVTVDSANVGEGSFSLGDDDTVPAIVLPSLESILQNPALKPAVWAAIRPLRQVTHS
ncbi:hypothetical protein L1F30_14270 [Simiduia sp. 21SJ11W-1]|uniref:hypothetical protein n=1 Tax=Simiduia sp. 21SJ11W-1 TaxID=2909669 RepID=UPI0020A16E82|nr:hypothetical protein [Simiduia sp. 21SJ11W-1]UTA47324.1 hypothetical protein L1F30_14270 [Simiduia sp. 21SJ11W-1]